MKLINIRDVLFVDASAVVSIDVDDKFVQIAWRATDTEVGCEDFQLPSPEEARAFAADIARRINISCLQAQGAIVMQSPEPSNNVQTPPDEIFSDINAGMQEQFERMHPDLSQFTVMAPSIRDSWPVCGFVSDEDGACDVAAEFEVSRNNDPEKAFACKNHVKYYSGFGNVISPIGESSCPSPTPTPS